MTWCRACRRDGIGCSWGSMCSESRLRVGLLNAAAGHRSPRLVEVRIPLYMPSCRLYDPSSTPRQCIVCQRIYKLSPAAPPAVMFPPSLGDPLRGRDPVARQAKSDCTQATLDSRGVLRVVPELLVLVLEVELVALADCQKGGSGKVGGGRQRGRQIAETHRVMRFVSHQHARCQCARGISRCDAKRDRAYAPRCRRWC